MAAKTAAVGSAAWLSSEKENVLQLLEQEKEELIYPAQHEVEWLNEHMAEIFSRNEFNVTDVFKTPGKLRGKTPRTARKRNAADARIPLSDVFSSKPHAEPSPARSNRQYKNSPRFAIAQDTARQPELLSQSRPAPPKSQADSGYHGSSQEEMEDQATTSLSSPPPSTQIVQLRDDERSPFKIRAEALSQGRRTTEGSFHSAKEEQTVKVFPEGQKQPALETLSNDIISMDSGNQQSKDHTKEVTDTNTEFDDIGSPSDESTPDRPLIRKSSLNFASLPAREPLNSRTSRTSHLDHTRNHLSVSNSVMPKQQHGQALQQELDHDADMSDDENIEILGHDESDSDSRTTRQYSKMSTQRLQDKIDMLGKAASRPSKSIPSAATLAASHMRHSEAANRQEKSMALPVDDEDDWIKPLNSPETVTRPVMTKSYTADVMQGLISGDESDEEANFDIRAPELIAYEERIRTPLRMSPSPGKSIPGFGHTKSASTATLVSPGKAAMQPPSSPAKSISVSNPSFQTTTPYGSPKRLLDGPLSASKSRLQSIMKTAKGLFTSSAGVSAAAKMETLSPHALRLAANKMPGLYPNLNAMLENKPLPESPPKESRKTRSSTEREKEAQMTQKMDSQLQKAREREAQKAAQFKLAQEKSMSLKPMPQPTRISPRRLPDEQRALDAADMPPPASQPQSKLSRPTRPIRENPAKPKPVPVSIRVGTLSQRMPISTSSLASNLQETLPAEPKRLGLTKKVSNASISSNAGIKATMSSQPPKPKALLAAERKKEQDEREAQRKLEQKREAERRRAVQQEEARRQEQKQRAEAERKERERVAAEQAKRQAQQQAIEKKRLENAKKVEQQRAAIDAAAARPPSRLGAAQPLSRSLIGHNLPTNPAKPAKRPLEEDAGPSRPQPARFGASTQPADGKRRKTEDENDAPRPTMSGAPIRQSHLGKKPSIFNHSTYTSVQPQPHLSQFPQPPPPRIAHSSAMAQYGNGNKIPFADAPNPPSHASKTPVSVYQQKTLQLVKSSPQYQNGETIHLPEIPTDSEDEDSEDEGNAFPIPDWATPGHLTDQLIRQEGIDGDAVFGPIAPLKMEEIFAKGNKERLKRMRDRTSSANWAMSGDGLTLEEIKIDREQRERMRLEGGWRYGS